MSNLTDAVDQVMREYFRALEKFGDFKNPHEGYAILLEEVDELWDEVKKNETNRDYEQMEKEAKQVAAMAIKFMVMLKERRS